MIRTSFLVAILVIASNAAAAHDQGAACARDPEVEYARQRAKLCESARNREIEAQRYHVNTSYLRLYGTPRLPVVPSRMIDPNLPVAPPH
ncbi:MAG: hypothetical protein P4L84_07765 [Isosphaeraceae bacterium]|nr:hypothetical protein [Isosphaeraceae bacterium]